MDGKRIASPVSPTKASPRKMAALSPEDQEKAEKLIQTLEAATKPTSVGVTDTEMDIKPNSSEENMLWWHTLQHLNEMLVEGTVHPCYTQTISQCQSEAFRANLPVKGRVTPSPPQRSPRGQS